MMQYNCCHDVIADQDLICYELEGCGHCICSVCFSTAQAKRCCNPYIDCPCANCNSWTRSWKLTKMNGLKKKDEEMHKKDKEMRFEIPLPSMKKDPKQFHKTLSNDQMKRKAILSLTLECNEELNVCVSAMDREEPPANWGEDNIKSLIVIFLYLHTLLIESIEMEESMVEEYLIPSNGAVDDDDIKDPTKCSVLHRCIHAFATGTVLGNEPNMNTSFRNERLASLTASEIIRTLRGKKQSHLKRFISRQLIANNVPKAVWRIMTKVGISPGIETLHCQL